MGWSSDKGFPTSYGFDAQYMRVIGAKAVPAGMEVYCWFFKDAAAAAEGKEKVMASTITITDAEWEAVKLPIMGALMPLLYEAVAEPLSTQWDVTLNKS